MLLRKALALWRGPALDGLACAGATAARRSGSRRLRLHVLEDRFDADLGRGQRSRPRCRSCRALVAEHPFRERLCAQLMLALYRTGRQTDALEVYRETRTPTRRGARARAERGAGQPRAPDARARPGPRARPKRAAAHGRARSVPPARGEPVRARRPVTVVFADVVDSVTLGELFDPESVHRILERYSEHCTRRSSSATRGRSRSSSATRWSAFFGLTELHEDDALRAIRAAVELRDAVMVISRRARARRAGSSSAISIGVNSGDVFVGGGAGRDTFATGDSVNVAARLEQEGRGVGDPARRPDVPTGRGRRPSRSRWSRSRSRVAGAGAGVEATRADRPTRLSWRDRHRLSAGGASGRRFERPLRWHVTQRTCRLCTIVGPAGIGKTRHRPRAGRRRASEAATIAVGRCLSYGEAITYQPLIEIVRQLVGDDPGRRHPEADGPRRGIRARGTTHARSGRGSRRDRASGGDLLGRAEALRGCRGRAPADRRSSRTSTGPSPSCST